MTKRVSFIEIDIVKCSNTYGSAPCTAEVGVTGSEKCFNCRNTCQDIDNITEANETVRYSKPSTNVRFDLDAIPNITVPNIASIQYAPPELQLGQSIGVRASLTVTFKDHRSPDTDATGDQYISERSYDPYNQGTYWGKFRARYPFLQGQEIRWIQGTDSQLISDMETRTFTIENSTGPNSAGTYSITAKDILKLTDGDRSQAPVAHDIQIGSGGITDSYTGVLFVGTGNQVFLPGGYCVIGGEEIVAYVDFGADPTNSNIDITARGQLNTVAKAHDEGAHIQQVLSYSGETPAYILNDLLTNYADIDPSLIPIADWDIETADYIGRTYTANIASPTAVVNLINEVLEQSASSMWWDNESQLIRWSVLKQPVVSAFNYSDSIVNQGTFNIADNYKARISRCWVFFGQLNPLLELTDERNYSTIVERKETQAEPFFNNRPSIKKIHSRWIAGPARDVAERLGDLILQRFNVPPRKVGFSVQRDSGVTVPELGGSYNTANTFIQDATGAGETIPIQVTSIIPGPVDYVVKAEEITYTQIIAADPLVVPVSLSTNEENVNLYDAFLAAGGLPDPDPATVVNVTVSTGIIIGSADTSLPAMVSGDWPSGVTINLVNNGYIVGRGGNGGDGGSAEFVGGSVSITADSTVGTDGGDAIELTFDVNIDNTNGIIGGGGGGGGGAGASVQGAINTFFIRSSSSVIGGSGGGGGAGSISGSGGSSGSVTKQIAGSFVLGNPVTTPALGGLAGSIEIGGADTTHAFETNTFDGYTLFAESGNPSSGGGGDLGQAGETGSDGARSISGSYGAEGHATGTGALGGAAGSALVENGGSVTWTLMGDVRGAVV